MGQTKITVKIHSHLLAAFNRDIDCLFLKRDALLNQLIGIETQYLAMELDGKRLSLQAKRHIAGSLKKCGTTLVNIVVDKTVANALNAVVDETNIVRDAFINRMLWLLRGGDALLDYLELPKFITGSAFDRFIPEAMPTAPLKAIGAIQRDPLHYLRVACEERHDTGLYLLDLPPEFTGFSCWLDDMLVPGTTSYVDSNKLIEELVAMEVDAFNNFAQPNPAENGDQS